MIPIKIQCGCGQRYAFDIEPVCGRMPGKVSCPVCGLDGTRVANEIIAYNLATEMAAQRSEPDKVMMAAVVGCMAAGLAGVIKAMAMSGGVDVLLCLVGATTAFGMALTVYFWKR